MSVPVASVDLAHSLTMVAPRATALPWNLSDDERRALAQLTDELRQQALVFGDFTLSSGSRSSYYLDVKRAIKGPVGFKALAPLIASTAEYFSATAVGGLTMGADTVADSAMAGGAEVNTFAVRKTRKEHGLSRWIEGPQLSAEDRCLVVDDVVTSGKSVLDALKHMDEENLQTVAFLTVVDRLAGGGERLARKTGIPFFALTTIDELHPNRDDR